MFAGREVFGGKTGCGIQGPVRPIDRNVSFSGGGLAVRPGEFKVGAADIQFPARPPPPPPADKTQYGSSATTVGGWRTRPVETVIRRRLANDVAALLGCTARKQKCQVRRFCAKPIRNEASPAFVAWAINGPAGGHGRTCDPEDTMDGFGGATRSGLNAPTLAKDANGPGPRVLHGPETPGTTTVQHASRRRGVFLAAAMLPAGVVSEPINGGVHRHSAFNSENAEQATAGRGGRGNAGVRTSLGTAAPETGSDGLIPVLSYTSGAELRAGRGRAEAGGNIPRFTVTCGDGKKSPIQHATRTGDDSSLTVLVRGRLRTGTVGGWTKTGLCGIEAR